MLHCGFGKKEITPPLGTPMVGYYEARFSKGAIDRLYTRAIAFDDGERKAVVIAVDVCLLSKEFCDDLRGRIADFCQIAKDAIFISCSHTHTGPLVGKDFASGTETEPSYVEFLKYSIRDAAAIALEDLKPSRLFTADTNAEGISFIRRYKMKDGTTRTNPGELNPDIDHPIGIPNEEVRLLKIMRDGGDDIYVVNFGTHSDTVGGDYISADYPGYVCSTLEGALPGSHCMFLLGPQGDVNHLDFSKPNCGKVVSKVRDTDVKETAAHARHMGRVIAGKVLAVCDRAKEIIADEISFGTKELEFPSNQENHKLDEARRINDLYLAGRKEELPETGMGLTTMIAEARRIIKLEHGPLSYKYSVYAVKIGEFVFAGAPGEPFTEIARRIYAGSPFENTMLCCLTNASCGYIATSKAYEEGGYETKTSVYKAGADDILVEGMQELLQELKGMNSDPRKHLTK